MGTLLLGAGLALAGTAMSMKGQSDANSAMNKQATNELYRQQGYQNQAKGLYQKSQEQEGAGNAQQKIASGQEAQQGMYDKLASQPLTTAANPIADNGNNIINARTSVQNSQSNMARSRLTGYDTWQLAQAIKNQQANQLLGVVGNQAQQSAAVSPYEIQAASHAGDQLKGWGGVTSSLGSIVGALGPMLGSFGTAATMAPTAAQSAGMQAGFGPLSAGSAATYMPASSALNGARFGNVYSNLLRGI